MAAATNPEIVDADAWRVDRVALDCSMSVALVLVLALFASACGGDGNADSTSNSEAVSSVEVEPTQEPTQEAPTPEPTSGPEPTEEPELEIPGLDDDAAWQGCGDGFECAAFDVPLDYERPDGEQFTLKITRSPARDEAARVGTVFVNPGGPGAGSRSIMDFYRTGPLNDVFDVVGIDNRGTGRSSAIACNDNFDEDLNQEIDESDGWDDEIQVYLDDFEVMAQTCAERYDSAVLASLTTENAARDMESIRIALGDEPMNYLGTSYGTIFGSVYATMFPDNIRTLVLDSAISPSNVDGLIDRAADYQLQYERLDRACALNPNCPMHEVGYIAGFEKLMDGLRSGAIEGATVGDALIIWTLVPSAPAVHFDNAAVVFALALGGDPRRLSQFGKLFAQSLLKDFAGGSNAAITCADGDRSGSAPLEEIRAEIRALAEESEDALLTRNVPAPCELWSVQGDGNPEINYTGDTPILVINNTGDALTPLRFAEVLVDELGPKATLVVNDSTGHGVFNTGRCITDLTMDYLVDLTMPEPGTTCDVEATLGLTMSSSGRLFADAFAPPIESELLPRDRIVSVNGTPLAEMGGALPLVVGQTLTVEILRDDETLTFDVTPGYTAAELWRLDE